MRCFMITSQVWHALARRRRKANAGYVLYLEPGLLQ